MEDIKSGIALIPNEFVREDGTFDKQGALEFGGHAAGECYNPEGFEEICKEETEATLKRIDSTLGNGHHSVFGHTHITFHFTNIPKILAMVLNNEREYNASEKSARYTKIVKIDLGGASISDLEHQLYDKWSDTFKANFYDKYRKVFDDPKYTHHTKHKLRTLGQENARYMVSVFMPTNLLYTTSFRQINYLAHWMEKYIAAVDWNNEFQAKLAISMQKLVDSLKMSKVLDERLMNDGKGRELTIFGKNLEQKVDKHFGAVYSTLYKGSFAQYAQAHRHRTLKYQLEMLAKKEYFVPPILSDDPDLVAAYIEDISKVAKYNPQGEMVLISEKGDYDDFILKTKERLCNDAQLEINNQTAQTAREYYKALEKTNPFLHQDMEKYMHGARCTSGCYECPNPCYFNEAIKLQRKM